MKRLACAVYTRKSSEEGLDKEFNSLDAQREACAAFILSQKHAGWVALPDTYDDGGLSGGTLLRPALQRLMDDVQHGKVQIVVVYKVDRLTRSLADFAKIVDVLDANAASFVSVTQQFNTTTSMGRLTLNMLLSFAQFEREIAGERIRDKIAASKAKGMWMGGNVPLGYDVRERKLVVNEAEAATVRLIFEEYLELSSVRPLAQELSKLGIVSKRRERASGALAGGNSLSRGALYTLLQNRLYRGEIVHQGKVYLGRHQAIVSSELWQAVQQQLSQNRQSRPPADTTKEPSLLAGLLVDGSGQRLTPTHATKGGRRYRYYVSTSLITRSSSADSQRWRLPAGRIEGVVLDRLRAFFASELEIGQLLLRFDAPAAVQRSVIARAKQLAEDWPALSTPKRCGVLKAILAQVQVSDDAIRLQVRPHAVVVMLLGEGNGLEEIPDDEPLLLSIPVHLHRTGRGIKLVFGTVLDGPDERLLVLLRQAYAVRQSLVSGTDSTIDAMALRLGLRRDHVSALIRVAYLAPPIVEAICKGQHPLGLTASRVLEVSKTLPADWRSQARALGFAQAAI